ncbi:MAG: glycosyltransferase family 2 protein [Bacteroidota bacterium]
MNFLELFTTIVDNLLLVYAILIMFSYTVLFFISAYSLRKYKRRNQSTDYEKLITSPLEPAVSVIAPCYNEEGSIVENINALLDLHYNNFQVIIVNDGSKDNSLQKAIEAYEMEIVHYFIPQRLKTQPIRTVYKSTNKAYYNLILIDKENGGKADALNAGINVSENGLIVCIDVDSIVEPDSLLKLAKPFLEARDTKVIASGGVVHIANSCYIERGRLIKRNIPKKLLPRIQVVEYARAFLIGRIAWSKLNGLLIISGALGMFDKEIVIKAGGYLASTVGEDMELVVRMRKYMFENKKPHKVEYIPDPLLWTEVPSDLKTLGRQRNRWTRGTMDTLFIHRKMFFNPKYKALGLLGYPFWFFFEWMAPIIEVLGLTYFIILAFIGSINWAFFLFLLAFIYIFSINFSFFSIFLLEVTFHQYKKAGQIFKLFLTSLIEPFLYHPLTVFWAIKGNISYFKGSKSWGSMSRSGFKEYKR